MCGGAFFAIPYLGLSFGVVPSIAIGAAAFGAGELVFRNTKKNNLKQANPTVYDAIQDAKVKNSEISNMVSRIEDRELVGNIREINTSVTKIISTVEKKPDKFDNMRNFFNYYLPVTIKILHRYDEIENQRLTSSESKKLMQSIKKMTGKMNDAFKEQLSKLYHSDIIDTDAEMKVIDTMLKSDGYIDENNLEVK